MSLNICVFASVGPPHPTSDGWPAANATLKMASFIMVTFHLTPPLVRFGVLVHLDSFLHCFARYLCLISVPAQKASECLRANKPTNKQTKSIPVISVGCVLRVVAAAAAAAGVASS